jgi:uncharacterized protein (DUF1697 family)
MKLLKGAFQQAGMDHVVTYINTGNIIFTNDELSKLELTNLLEETIATHFGLQIKIVIRSIEEIEVIISSLPDSWTNDTEMRSDVIFLWDEIDNESVLKLLTIKPDIDRVHYVPGAILWSVDRQHATKSGLAKIIGTKLYSQISIRNVNTARKIYELMQAVNT